MEKNLWKVVFAYNLFAKYTFFPRFLGEHASSLVRDFNTVEGS